MRTLLLLNCYLFLIGYSLADNDGRCTITDISDLDFQTVYSLPIDDTKVDTAIAEHAYTGLLDVLDYTTTEYFTVTKNDTHFIIRTTLLFGSFDERTPKQSLSVVLENLNVHLRCIGGTSTLAIQIPVTDINSHPPVFSLSNYEFRVAAPIMPRTDFSIYGDAPITATDVDFSNQDVIFTVTPDDFDITTIASSTSKEYTSVLRAKRVIQVIGVQTYTITATDTGINPGPLSSTATFALIVDYSTSLDTPIFVKTSYSFNYTVEDDIPNLILLDGPISIRTNKRSFLSDPVLAGDFSEYFNATLDRTTVRIELTPKGLLPPETGSFFILTVSVTTDNTAAASLIVYRKQSEIDNIPAFDSHVYTGSYSDVTGQVTLDNGYITVTSYSVPKVNISGAYSDHFNVVYDEQAKTYQIAVSTDLTGPEIKSLSYLRMIIMATIGDNYDTAAVILTLPEHELQFSDVLYIAEYNSDNTVTVDNTNPIGFTTDVVDVTVTVLGTYGDNFDVTYNALTNEYSIVVSTPLSTDTLNTEELIELVLTAVNSYGDVAQSVVSVYLPNVNIEAPTFSEIIYLAKYQDDEVGSALTLDHDIFINNKEDQESIEISLGSYNTIFEVVYNTEETKWELRLLSPIPDDILLSRNDIIITMTAEENGNGNEGHAVLYINWIPEEAPIFSEAYYLGHYLENELGVIELEKDIEITNIKDPANVVVSLDSFADYFEITYISNKWTLTKIKPIPILTGEYGELVITLTAIETGNKKPGQSVLVLDLPQEEQPPIFLDAYYLAEYPENGKGIIEFENSIEFFNINDPTTIQISLDNYGSNFEIIYDTNRWYINIISSLEDTVLHRNVELVMALIATEDGNANQGESALVLKLPTATFGTAPKFSEAYYIANYPEDGTGIIQFETDISFLNVDDPTSLTLKLDKYASNFDIIYQSNKWYINIKDSLEDTVLHQNVEIVMTILAAEVGNPNEGESALVLKLPTATYGTAPKFSHAYYIANYPEDGIGIIEFADAISFLNVDDPTSVTITLDNYVNNFEIVLISNKWYVMIITPIDESVLNENAELVMSLVATENGKSSKGYSALVLKIPPANIETPPLFSKAIYSAEYKISDGQAIVAFTDAIHVTSKTDLSDISITVNNYPSYFNIVYNRNTGAWVMNVVNQISDEILLAKTDLVVTITAIDITNGLTDQTVVDITLPPLNTETSPKFSKTYYTAKYTISDATPMVTFDVPLTITNRDDLEDISISIDPYVNNFNIIYDVQSKEWKMNVVTNLDESVLNAKVDLVMGLLATDKTTGEIGECSLVLTLPIVNNGEAPNFSSIYYSGEYLTDNGGTIELENTIQISNKNDPTAITISFDDSYRNNFEIIYDRTNSKWILNVISPLDDLVVKNNADLIVTLTATERNNPDIGQAALLLHLPAAHVKLAPKFSLAHYFANYVVENGRATIDFNNTITVINKEDFDSISVTLDSFSTNFKLNYDSSKKEWIISVTQPLPDDILNSNTELVLTLLANEKDNENIGDSTLILTLPSSGDNSGRDLKFSQVHYSAEYDIEEDNNVVKINGAITVTSTLDVTGLTVSLQNDPYAEYFTITKEDDKYVVTVAKPLTSDILNREISIALTLVASVDTSVSYATLVVNLPATVKERAIEFALTLYNGIYKIDDGSFQVTDTIRVETVEDDANIEYSLSSNTGYEEYFGISYSAKVVTVTAKEIPTNLLRGRSVIPLLLRVGVTGTLDSSTAVLNVKVENNDEDYTPILFSNILYHGKYEVTDGVGDLAIDGEIKIDTDEVDGNVEVSVSKDYEIYFGATYLNKVVTVGLLNELPTDILESHSFIPLTLQVGVKGTTNQASAVLNIEIIYDSEADVGSIEFSTVLYGAQYSVSDGTGHLELNRTIQVITDTSDDKIIPSISNEAGYGRYFTVEYSNKVVSLGLAQESLPHDVSVNSFIALTLTVAISGTTHTSSAVLNINIVSDNDENHDTDSKDDGCPMKTTYIVSIVLLSILVVGLIAAAVAFYYFKLRSKNYSNLDEERDTRTRYERNIPTTRASTDLKHTPLDERRPTGFIFKPLDEDTTDTTNDFDKNRRKSVAFDDNVEKLQIESPIDEDNDASEDDNNISDKTEVTHV